MDHIVPVKLGPDSQFEFDCHKNMECFTKCCRDITIVLTPYDIIRLKNRLKLTSEEFLAIYTEPKLLEKTDLPFIILKSLDDDVKSCPFVKDNGCIIYNDRPTSCRYYPLGVASLSHKEKEDNVEDEFYFFVNEPHCLGFQQKKKWTVRDWRKNQGIDIHDQINAGWSDLIVKKKSFPPNIKLTEQSKKMFFLVNYNIDSFKKFVFESSFLQRYDIDSKIITKIKKDELELLMFGIKWLKWLLFKDGNFKLHQTT